MSNLNSSPATSKPPLATLDPTLQKIDEMMDDFWADYPDLYETVQVKKQEKVNASIPLKVSITALNSSQSDAEVVPIFNTPLRGEKLRQKRYEHHCQIRQKINETGSQISHRTQAQNKKSAHETLEEEQAFRGELVADQLRTWRSILPELLKQFAKVPDYRNPSYVKHKIAVLMMYGLLAFIFRLSSRREMNRELTGPVITEPLRKLFPELESIPHADTLARLLAHTDPKEIEAIHVRLVAQLIRKKKFKKLLINGCLPIAIDGTQKLVRDDLLQDDRWCERKKGNDPESKVKEQYLYAIEANITLQNGLTIPLMTEYLYRENNQLKQAEGKQDNELTAIRRLIKRLHQYFPRLKIMIIGDAMLVDISLLKKMSNYGWEYMIRAPRKKLKFIREALNSGRKYREALDNAYYRERKQSFYWKNNIEVDEDYHFHVVGCLEEYEMVNRTTGKIETCYSEHAWISSQLIDKNNVHELTNLAGRKNFLLENNINQAKNHGYQYKHLFSYNWHAIQGFHYLMRLAQAINSLSEWTKVMRKNIKAMGWSATLKLIKETLFAPWLSAEWYEAQLKKSPQLRLQFE